MNPLCTYINTSPRFTSPHPLSVASTPLTIPVKLTLSEFKLSGFVILVFSKEKGITLVFRNDPLESMRVQSSFDSIPFIKNYLQKEIERQVRGLFQEELPLAVYKLSLRLLDQDNGDERSKTEQRQDKFSAQSLLSPAEEQEDEEDDETHDIATEETEAISERNMLCLRALMNSQKTLSLFTPTLNDAIFRATSPSSIWDRSRMTPADTPSTPASDFLDRTPGLRPGLHSRSSSMSVSGGHVRRKRKHRIVNLRKGRESTASVPSSEVSSSEYADNETVASAPEIGGGNGVTEPPVHLGQPRKLSLVDESSLLYNSGQQSPPPSTPVRSRRSYLESTFMENLPRSPESRPQLSRGARYSSGIVERAFVMQFMAEMRRQAEERQDEGSSMYCT